MPLVNRRSPMPALERKQGYRKFRSAKSLRISMIWSFLGLVGVTAMIAAVIAILTGDERGTRHAIAFGAGLAAFILFTTIRYVHTSQLKCGLCHNPVAYPKGSSPHRDAEIMPPLTHRQTCLVNAVFRGRFICMHCGTPYRMGGGDD